MNTSEFNEKWNDFLENGFYGLAISNEEVIEYLDKEFTEYTKVNEKFSYSQIKTKFGFPVVYTNNENFSIKLKDGIEKILKL